MQCHAQDLVSDVKPFLNNLLRCNHSSLTKKASVRGPERNSQLYTQFNALKKNSRESNHLKQLLFKKQLTMSCEAAVIQQC